MRLSPSPTVATALALSLAASVPRLEAQTEAWPSTLHDYRVETVAEGLVNPWSIAFLPSGDMLVSERPGRLRIVRGGRLLPDPVAGVPEVRQGGQGGLLDVELHPDFGSNRLLYLSYSKPSPDGSQGTTAVVRGRLESDRLVDVEEVVEAQVWSEGRGHHGSRLAFDGAGHLFVSLGDRQAPPRGDLEAHPAQDLTNHFGTILRLQDDGGIPGDNPFVGREDALPEIWSYGHRNVQGLAVHPETGILWANEHGPQGGDELNRIEAGANYGWPVVGYGVNYRTGSAIHEGTMREGMEHPQWFWVPSIATSGLLFYTGDRFPGWRGNAFVGGLSGQQLARLTLEDGQVVAEETLLRGFGRIRDAAQGPDGLIYLAIDDRGGQPTTVVRLVPTDS
ncbi:MAG: PQQ-dependent sugar dehydrogenase [Gemmatimonadota bacterium]|jgi:glucose/arabinose dehydrogenase